MIQGFEPYRGGWQEQVPATSPYNCTSPLPHFLLTDLKKYSYALQLEFPIEDKSSERNAPLGVKAI